MSNIKIELHINNKRQADFTLEFKEKSINHNSIKSNLNKYLFEHNIFSEFNEEEDLEYKSIKYFNYKYKALVSLKKNENLEIKEVQKLFIMIRIKSEIEKKILNQFIEIDKELDILSEQLYFNNENNDNNIYNDSELDIAVLTANPIVNIVNKNIKEEIKELSSMNDFNNITNSIYNKIKASGKIIKAEFLPLTINNLKDVIKLKPKILHLICKSTYIINDINNNEVIYSYNYANLIFEDNEYFNMRAIKRNDLNDIFDKYLIKNTILIISTQLSKDIYEMVKVFEFQNILVQHTTIANSSFVEDFNYYFYRNIIEHMEHISIDLYNKNAQNMSKNKNVQFCCCFHHHIKTCKLFKNLENELYVCNDKDNKDESIFIPHFEHLHFKCNCQENGNNEGFFDCHMRECINNHKGTSRVNSSCCCYKKIEEIKKNHKNEFIFHNFLEKSNNIKLGSGKDGIAIINNNKTENIPNYEIMKVITGRNIIVYEIYNELFKSNNNFINIYKKENIDELDKLADIIIEYLKERNNNDNDLEIAKNQKPQSNKLINEPLKFDYKTLKSSPNLTIINKNYYFEKKILKKDEKRISNEYNKDNKNLVYFLIIEDDEIKDKIFDELSKKNLKIVFMTKNKININNKNNNKITQIELKKKRNKL